MIGQSSNRGVPLTSFNVAKREGFTTRLGVIAATLGSAVGLGNIWKFPFLTGVNGGAAFIIIYLVATLLVGLPVMISELAMGREAKANAIGALRRLAPRQVWWLVGAAGVLAAFLILAFYTEVAAWVLAYILKAAAGGLASTDPQVTSKAFEGLVASPWQSLVWQWVVLAWVSVIIIAGVSKGIEAMTKRLMPLLFVLLLVIDVRSLTLPGAAEGLRFLFRPDFSAVTWGTLLVALGLSFFKLSVGMGTMITYGSYFRNDQNIPATAGRVMLADLCVSILAGLAIFPAVFAFGFKPNAGPSLLFITIPAVFSQMPLGNVFMVLFFVLAAVAATGAMLSLFEVPVAYLNEQFKWVADTGDRGDGRLAGAGRFNGRPLGERTGRLQAAGDDDVRSVRLCDLQRAVARRRAVHLLVCWLAMGLPRRAGSPLQPERTGQSSGSSAHSGAWSSS